MEQHSEIVQYTTLLTLQDEDDVAGHPTDRIGEAIISSALAWPNFPLQPLTHSFMHFRIALRGSPFDIASADHDHAVVHCSPSSRSPTLPQSAPSRNFGCQRMRVRW